MVPTCADPVLLPSTKTAAMLLVLIVLRIAVALSGAGALSRNQFQSANRLSEIVLLVPMLGLFLFFMLLNRKEIGIRHLLPILPLLFVYLARVWSVASGRRRLQAALLALLVWDGVSSLRVYPDYLVYFNEMVGGPEGGLKISVVGEDWGQDVAGLGKWMKANGVEEVYYTPYGSADPRAYGVNRADSVNHKRIPCHAPEAPGIYALHIVEKLRPIQDRPPDCYQWLDKFKPIEKIGHTIWIYRISEQDLAGGR
jgi:hypothetical protein